MCPECQELQLERPIDVPSDLSKVIRMAKARVADGSLQSLKAREGIVTASKEPIEFLSPDGPWDDILLYWFSCANCKARFTLFADTYHGRGGWTRGDGGSAA